MYIRFRTRKLEKCYLSVREGSRAWGDEVARRYIQRVDVLKAIEQLDDLVTLPQLRFHPLAGNRKGQYAINITGFMRLIFTLEKGEPVVIKIEEVSKHYDD